MLRSLKEAFWLRVPLAGLGALPLNVIGLAGFGILGFAEHAFWLLGLGAEAAYLLALVTNRRFQQVVAAKDLQDLQTESTRARHGIRQTLPDEARARLARLEEKILRIAALYRANPDDNLLADSNLDALGKLAELFARLLGAEQQLRAAQRDTDQSALARQADSLQRELDHPHVPLSPSLRESKTATLALLRKRLANAGSREHRLAETESDLARIQAQVDLALEEAGLQGSRPPEAAGHLNLLNQILDSNTALEDTFDPFPAAPAAAAPPARRPVSQ